MNPEFQKRTKPITRSGVERIIAVSLRIQLFPARAWKGSGSLKTVKGEKQSTDFPKWKRRFRGMGP
jgi:hypothetical protein